MSAATRSRRGEVRDIPLAAAAVVPATTPDRSGVTAAAVATDRTPQAVVVASELLARMLRGVPPTAVVFMGTHKGSRWPVAPVVQVLILRSWLVDAAVLAAAVAVQWSSIQ